MKNIWIGAAFGVALFVLCFAIGGFGHGFFVPSMIAGAPLGMGIVFIPVLWPLWGWLAGYRRRWIFPSVMFLVYAEACWQAMRNWDDDFHNPYRNTSEILRLTKPYLTGFVLVYLSASLWLWFTYLRCGRAANGEAAGTVGTR